ncbi:hypothetical protein [Rhizobium grahamii]|uniref:Transmembrane protein n=1 Tax=Rhizobium grahamii CCGE 502 TaxID=990285 RepID=S3HBY8_9HYPH|nr:hypothetical protein [Rhizobium grahamii]EPE96212.1 hypothetical protein RGCCGE502_21580 [Rhizobium grahamii CCGE 502]
MIHHDDKRSGVGFPLIAILIAMAAIVGTLAMNAEHTRTATRVWVPTNSALSVTTARVARPDLHEAVR